jgi:hypothetical protein
MQKIFYTASLVAVIAFTACKNDDAPKLASENTTVLPVTDAKELVEFKEWQLEKMKKENNIPVTTTKAPVRTRTIVKKVPVYTPAPAPATTTTPADADIPGSADAKKKGWSKAAKGTAIGAGVGAAAGALILKKNRVLGGVIGGVVGGGVGYGIGRSMDKKDGRVQ